jgi:signal transduction histidine kinase
MIPLRTVMGTVLVLAGTGLLTLGLLLRRGESTSPAQSPFALMLGIAGLSGVVLGGLGIADATVPQYGAAVGSLWLFLSVPYLVFATTYTGWRRLVTPRSVGIVTAFMTAEVLLIMFDPLISSRSFLANIVTWIDIVAVLTSLIFGIVGIAVVVRTTYTSPLVDRQLGSGLLAAGAGPWLTLLFAEGAFVQYDLGGVVGLIAVGFSISSLAAMLVVLRTDVFESTPAAANLGRSTVFGALNEPVLVVDDQRRVVDLNEAATTTFDVELETIAGEPVQAIVGRDPYALCKEAELELHTVEGPRQFTVSISAITDEHDRAAGHAILFQDVTTERTQRQRLAVLNRVLRHNLRNRMNVLEGYAEVLDEYVDDDRPEEYVDEILTTAAGLSELGEKARSVEKVLSAPRETSENVRLSTVVETVAEEIRERYPETTVVSHLEADPALELNPLLVEHALSQIAENAVEHNDDTEPTVELRTRKVDDGQYPLSISIADDGPGIPEHERTALQSGDETPLEHGSGLGLWAANWVVTRLGGRIDFDSNEPEGTVVTIELPAGQETAEPAQPADAGSSGPTGTVGSYSSEGSVPLTAEE